MKVLMLLSNGFDPDIRVQKEAVSLTRLGHEISVWCWDRSLSYISQPELHAAGFSIRRFFIQAAYGSGFRQIFPLIRFYVAVWRAVSREEFDAIHAHDFDTLFLGWLLKKKLHCRLIYDQHDLFDLYFRNRGGLGRAIASVIVFSEKVLLRDVDSHIVVTENMKNLIKKRNVFTQAVIINNAPMAERFITTKKKYSDKMRISYIGSVNYYDSIETACSVIAAFPEDYVFSIHGRGLDVDRLRSEYGTVPNIHIFGEYSYEDIPLLYENCDIAFAFYQTKIGALSMPNKFFESLMTCTPMIVNEASEFGKIVKKNGWGFGFNEVGFKENLFEFLQSLLIDRSIIETVRDKMRLDRRFYSWESNEEVLSGIYPL